MKASSVVLASCAGLPAGDGDDDELVAALQEAGHAVRWDPWGTEPDADLVILRATWDYTSRLGDFLDWTRGVPVLANPAGVVAWNAHKRYLLELADDGVDVVPTRVLSPGDAPSFPDGEVVVKPAVGAGSRGAARHTDHRDAAEHVTRLHADGVDVLVQPYQADVDAHGEVAMVFVDGRPSHAFHKAAMLPGGAPRPDDESRLFRAERLGPHRADEPAWRLGERALRAATARVGLRASDLLYARVDVIGCPARVLEVELIEPSLGWRQVAGDQRAGALAGFVDAVSRRLKPS